MKNTVGSPRRGVGRRGFLGAVAAAAVTPAIAAPVAAQAPAAPSARNGRNALVLAGGANRGAYEAGVIAGLVALAGVTDGQPLPFDAICGTSIGALNAYFVATAQYTKLQTLWTTIATRNVFQLKPEFARITVHSSGIVTRMYQAVRLGFGLSKNVAGVLDPSPLITLLDEIVQPATDVVHVPLYISTTNLSERRGQLWKRAATSPAGRRLDAENVELIADYAPGAVRDVPDTLVRTVLRASAAIPLAFDPVKLPAEDGSHDEDFVDGGVTDNVPMEIARRLAENVRIVLVDPPLGIPDQPTRSGLDVALGVFETMQRRILEYEVLLAVAESAVQSTPMTDAAGLRPLPLTPWLIQPTAPQPGTAGDFTDQAAMDAMWVRGYQDGVKGWPPVDFALLRGRLSIP